MTSIGIVDNDRFALAMLAQTVGRALPGVRVIWAVESGAQALHHCLYDTAATPDVLLLDMSLTDLDGVEVCRRIRMASDRPAILGITSYAIDHYRQAAINAGAQGLIPKSSTPRELAAAIRVVADGGVIGEGFMDTATAYRSVGAAAQPVETLSERERQVLDRYAANRSTDEIARELGIKPATVFVVVGHAKAKLGAATRAEAIRIYLASRRADSTH
ncbi:response regulator transcription factor [Bifidobacterium amazonense]|uniref:Response regulator transcription factor n=1 Tax=Bifidobacterium amazonense TaxID=2809027 RepID=A0ABS9VU15_9BIFI|nr:response regulator transcription factor [Bifidobacterium amazonense]MCH9275595.1 response regulator transcription factor [Bifidobacterium amazonense]